MGDVGLVGVRMKAMSDAGIVRVTGEGVRGSVNNKEAQAEAHLISKEMLLSVLFPRPAHRTEMNYIFSLSRVTSARSRPGNLFAQSIPCVRPPAAKWKLISSLHNNIPVIFTQMAMLY